jgi:hypothetical protein
MREIRCSDVQRHCTLVEVSRVGYKKQQTTAESAGMGQGGREGRVWKWTVGEPLVLNHWNLEMWVGCYSGQSTFLLAAEVGIAGKKF